MLGATVRAPGRAGGGCELTAFACGKARRVNAPSNAIVDAGKRCGETGFEPNRLRMGPLMMVRMMVMIMMMTMVMLMMII